MERRRSLPTMTSCLLPTPLEWKGSALRRVVRWVTDRG